MYDRLEPEAAARREEAERGRTGTGSATPIGTTCSGEIVGECSDSAPYMYFYRILKYGFVYTGIVFAYIDSTSVPV
jgi:hypothetical protein